jgi:hypothetical protein
METNAAVAASSTASAIRPLQLSTQYLIDCAVQQQQRGLIAIKGDCFHHARLHLERQILQSGCFGGWPADAMNFSRTIGDSSRIFCMFTCHFSHSASRSPTASGGLPLEQDYSYSAVSSTCPTRPLSLYSAPKAIMCVIWTFVLLLIAHHHAVSSRSVSRGDEDAIADAVAQHGAVSVIVETLQDFSSYSGGAYSLLISLCVDHRMSQECTTIARAWGRR